MSPPDLFELSDADFSSPRQEPVRVEPKVARVSDRQNNKLFDLYDHQAYALDLVRDSLRSGKRRPTLQAPCGFGKTVVAAHIIDGAMNKGKRVAITVPSLDLIDQTLEKLSMNGLEMADMGVMQANHDWNRPHAPIQICSVMTLESRGWPLVDFVVCDENHIQFDVLRRWMAEDKSKIFVGLSATPWAKGMADYWDDLLIPTTINELIEKGFAPKIKLYAPSHPDLKGIKVIAGEYHEGQLSERMRAPQLVADVVQTWMDKSTHEKTLFFGVDRAHAMAVHEQFQSCGINSAYIDGTYDRDSRKQIFDSYNKGDVPVICSVDTMTTGNDLDVRNLINGRPLKSEMRFVQIMGRGMRMADGKEYINFFDHSDTSLKGLGFFQDIHYAQLKGGKPNSGGGEKAVRVVALPKECPQCKELVPAKIRECQGCGFKFKAISNVVTKDGELEEVGSKVQRKRNRETTIDDKEYFYGELKSYCIDKGWREGWAARKYKDRFGVWPNDPRVKYARPVPISMETRSWIRGQTLRWVKSKQAASRRNGDAMEAIDDAR